MSYNNTLIFKLCNFTMTKGQEIKLRKNQICQLQKYITKFIQICYVIWLSQTAICSYIQSIGC
jgi:hypothetical protein